MLVKGTPCHLRPASGYDPNSNRMETYSCGNGHDNILVFAMNTRETDQIEQAGGDLKTISESSCKLISFS